jgi:hypothetical protein
MRSITRFGSSSWTLVLATACTGAIAEDRPPSIDGGGLVVVDAEIPRDGGITTMPVDGGPVSIDPGTIRLAEGPTLEGLALFQGVQVRLAVDGAPVASRNAPVVAARRAVVRAYVSTLARTTVSGELEVREGARIVAIHRDTITLDGASRDDAPESVLAFDVPAEQITETASLSVRLVSASGTPASSSPHPARLPRDGSTLPLRAEDDGAGLELVLVPIRWDGDGSGRLPDTSDAWLERLRSLLTAMYPLVDVELRVRAPVPWNDSLTWTGNVDFGAINSMLLDLRVEDGASPRAYYYALVAPAESHAAYCGGGCTNGQSFVVSDPASDGYRVGSGVGFGTEATAQTLAHELGHIHGRRHAPCGGANGPDPAYPYDVAAIGVWGFDPRTSTFFDPSETHDFMSYCSPDWISDYTWSAIFERTIAVSALSAPIARETLRVRVGGERGAVLAGRSRLPVPRSDLSMNYAYLDAQGAVIARGSAPALEQSHSDEELVVLPAPPSAATRVRVGTHELAL